MEEALLVVDFQNDFARPDGALSVAEGDEIADRVNELARSGRFGLVVATRDWHPSDHGSFEEHGGPWPPHCVQGSEGAELHPALDRDAVDYVIDKGQEREADGYSGFEVPELERILREHHVDAVTVVGLATDYCVRQTSLDAIRQGFEVTVDPSAVRAVDVKAGDGEKALDEIRAAGGAVESR